jgi:poly(3-hydroxyalkanoate) synthetase
MQQTFPDSPTRDASATHDAGGVVRDMLSMQTETFKAVAKGWGGYARRRFRPTTTPMHVMYDGVKWCWTIMDRHEPEWASPNEVMWESDLAKLRDFSQGSRKRVVPTLSLPPQAGHHSCIIDYFPEQSQISAVRKAGLDRAYAIEWLGVTQETKDVTIDDYLAVIDRAVDDLGGKVNLIGNCQGGWLGTMWAALNPDKVNTLIVGGAPIDTHAGNSVVAKYKRFMTPGGRIPHYRALVKASRGILPGKVMLVAFISMRPQNEVAKQLGLLAHLDDADYVANYAKFEDWWRYMLPLPGKVYLWGIEHLFLKNGLIEGDMEIGGEMVDLSKIKAPLYLLGGSHDHITPSPQVFALANYVGTPPEDIVAHTVPGGHIGLFIGHDSLREYWAPILADVAKRSQLAPAVRKSRTADAERPLAAVS